MSHLSYRSHMSHVLCVSIVLIFTELAGAADWPQWRGPLRNGVSAETGWSTKWGAQGPKRLWSIQVGQGYSAVAVAAGRVYTLGNDGRRDTVYCLDAGTGKVIWRRSYTCGPGDPQYAGPRSTPTVDGKFVYTLSIEGHAFCLDAASGRPVWSKNFQNELGAYPPQWGFAGSPLIQGGLVIYNVGTAGAALNKQTGSLVWQTGSGQSGYASPVPFVFNNQRGVAMFTANSLVALNPANGKYLWQHPWETSYNVNAADPVFSGGYVFISSNYNRGCTLLRLGAGRPSFVWETREIRNHFSSSVILGGSIYGNDQNTLKCVDMRSGATRWQMRGMGKGGLIAADGKLILLTERGELVIINADPARCTEVARARVLSGTCWTHPVLSGKRIYGRSHEGELVCLDVS